MAQWVKDPMLSLQPLRSLLWHGFNPWSGNFHLAWAQSKKQKMKKEKRQEEEEDEEEEEGLVSSNLQL